MITNNTKVRFIQDKSNFWIKYPFELALPLIYLIIGGFIFFITSMNKDALIGFLVLSVFSYVFLILDKKIIPGSDKDYQRNKKIRTFR